MLRCWLKLHDTIRGSILWHEYQVDRSYKEGYYDYHVDTPTVSVDKLMAYDSWTDEMKMQLDLAFYYAYTYLNNETDYFPGEYLPRIAPNGATPPDYGIQLTVLSHDDAWKRYLGTIAHGLALEIGNFVPWSIVPYHWEDLRVLFESDWQFSPQRWVVGNVDYPGWLQDYDGYLAEAVTAPPTQTFESLLNNDTIRPNQRDTIGGFLSWGHTHLHHAAAFPPVCYDDALCAEILWSYRGAQPAAALMEGTTFLDPTVNVQHGPAGWVDGCHGMAEFAQQMLRAINIPVARKKPFGNPNLGSTGHSTPFFYTIGATLSHGDDVYTGGNKSTPPFPGDYLLLPLDTYEEWFVETATAWEHSANVGRRAHIEMPLRALSDELVQRYCADTAAGVSHDDGTVAAFSGRKTQTTRPSPTTRTVSSKVEISGVS